MTYSRSVVPLCTHYNLDLLNVTLALFQEEVWRNDMGLSDETLTTFFCWM